MFLELFFKTRVAHDMRCALKKIIMAEVSGHIQSRIYCICGKLVATVLVATKLGRVVAYLEELQTMKTCNVLITWSGKAT